MHREEGLSFAHVVTFNLDEYYPMDPGSIHSYHRFMWENLFSQLDIAPEQRPHPARRRAARARWTRSAGATRRRSARPAASTSSSSASGAPGTSASTSPARALESRTRLITLDLVTRKDAAADFFGEENVPREAITMGVATILEAREIVILATGEHKARDRAPRGRGRGGPRGRGDLPAAPPDTTFYLDGAAAAPTSPGSRRPGCWARSSGRRRSTVRAVVWLSQRDREGDPQADPARLRRAPALVAGGAARLAGRAQRPRLQRARRQDPGPLEAAARPADHLLLAPSRRRRDLDGRDPAQAGRERERRSPSPT